jgi:hypothetical protein
MNIYIVCEKTYFDRLGEQIEDETNIFDSDSVDGLLNKFKSKNIKMAKRTIYKAIKNKKPVENKYFIYKIKI